MTAEVLGLEYEFKVRQTIQLLKMIIKVFNLIFILGGGPHGWRSYETGVLGNESNAQCPNHQGMYLGENCHANANSLISLLTQWLKLNFNSYFQLF